MSGTKPYQVTCQTIQYTKTNINIMSNSTSNHFIVLHIVLQRPEILRMHYFLRK